MGMRHQKRRVGHQAADKIAMARMLIEEADQRWHGMAAFLERSGLDQNDKLVSRLAHRAERRERRRHYLAEQRAGRG
jgi:hypothetical protein